MVFEAWRDEYPPLIDVLKARLDGKDNCLAILSGFEELMASIWRFTAQLMGDRGIGAVSAWSIRLAAQDTPLLEAVQVQESGIEFGGLRDYVAAVDCSLRQLLDALVGLCVAIFHTLSELAGDTITGPLLRHLEEGK